MEGDMEVEVVATEGAQSTEAAQPTEGQAPTEPQEGQEEQAPEETAEDKAKREASSRFQDLIHRRKEAERAAEAERQRAEDLQRRLEALEAQRQAPKPPTTDAPPKLDDFESLDEWQAALVEHAIRQAESRADQREAARKVAEAQRTEEQQWQDRANKYQTEETKLKASLGEAGAKQFEETVSRLDAFVLGHDGKVRPESAPLVRALYEAGPKVAQALAEDLDLADRLANADPLTVGIEIGRLQAKVQDGGRQGRRFSSAPPPEPILAGGRATPGVKDYSAMTGAEYMRARQEEEAARRKELAGRP